MAASKYRSKKTECVYGHLHDSKREARRCEELHLLEKGGYIRELQTQVRYELIPGSYEETWTGSYYKRGSKRGEKIIKRKCVDRPCFYVADFVYLLPNGQRVIEDSKGKRTKEYIIKRKLMRQKYCDESTIFKET